MGNITFLSLCRNQLQQAVEATYNSPFNQYSINSYVPRTKVSGDDKVRDFWCQILSSERIVGTTFQHLWVILNLLEGGSDQLRHCVPGEASDMHFYPKPGWFLTDQVTKSRCISKTVSRLSENSSSCPVPAFVEFKYSVIYGKMFFQQEITDAEVGTSYADC